MPPNLEFYSKHYLPTLVNQKNIAYQVVQSTTHWAFLLVGAVLAVLFNNPKFPNIWSLLLVGFLLLFVIHIGIRVAKGYINQIRWNLLERELLLLVHDTSEEDAEKRQTFGQLVKTYHCEWQSPVGTARLAAKVLFELGFFSLLVGILSLLVYLYLKVGDVPVEYKNLVVAAVGILAVAEIVVFRYESEYLRKRKPHPYIKF